MSLVNFIAPIWQDSQGGLSATYVSLIDQTPLVTTPFNALLAAWQACSSCNMVGVVVQNAAQQARTGTPGSHPLVVDQGRVQLANGTNPGYLVIPGPVDSIFLPASSTINVNSTLMLALAAQLFPLLGDSTGLAWNQVIGGKRRVVVPGQGNY
jgi:hypothetical protein